MIRIAIVDDDRKLCSRIEKILLAYNDLGTAEFDVEVFYSGEELFRFINHEHDFDLIFLDIQMRYVDGVEVGKRLRFQQKNNIVQIVYMTSLQCRDRELFEIRPMGFIAKPVEKADIVKTLDTYMELYEDMGKLFDFISERQHLKIPYEEILYFKSENKIIRLYTQGNVYSFYGQLSDTVKKLPLQFLNIHKSYIINKNYIFKYNYDYIIMTNQEIVPISQKNKKKVRLLLMKEGLTAGEEFF